MIKVEQVLMITSMKGTELMRRSDFAFIKLVCQYQVKMSSCWSVIMLMVMDNCLGCLCGTFTMFLSNIYVMYVCRATVYQISPVAAVAEISLNQSRLQSEVQFNIVNSLCLLLIQEPYKIFYCFQLFPGQLLLLLISL